MASGNIWAVAAQESPGAAISKLQIERWSGETDESMHALRGNAESTIDAAFGGCMANKAQQRVAASHLMKLAMY